MDCCGKTRCPRGIKIVGMVIMGLVAAVVFGLIFGYFVMLLWNWLMPSLFGLGTIDFWKAFGLILLVKLLFGGHESPHNKFRHHHKHHHDHGGWDGGDNACWGPKGGWQEQEGFDEWWREEGKGAFERYLENKKPNDNDKNKDTE